MLLGGGHIQDLGTFKRPTKKKRHHLTQPATEKSNPISLSIWWLNSTHLKNMRVRQNWIISPFVGSGWKFQTCLKPPPKCYHPLTNWDDPPSNPWKGAGLWYILWHYSPHAPFVQIWIISAFQGVKIPNIFETTSQLFTTFFKGTTDTSDATIDQISHGCRCANHDAAQPRLQGREPLWTKTTVGKTQQPGDPKSPAII